MKSYQNTKIVATIGPATDSLEMMEQLILAGVDVFRINMSHSDHKTVVEVLEKIEQVNNKLNVHVGILADLQGPKLRIGEIEGGTIPIEVDEVLTFINEPCVGTKERIYMSYPSFAADVKVGELILVDDGKVGLTVVETNGTDKVKLKVTFGHELSSKKGVNLPDTKISLPSLTEKDLEDLNFLLTQPIHWIALSFVRNASDIKALKKLIANANHNAKVIAKIEKPQAVAKIDKIISVSDAVMVARGDLGVEMPIEKLPAIQKAIIAKCIQKGKPVIVATQMMDSMVNNPTPTRAEVTDVANAVLDGTDAVMLSNETSTGSYPLQTVQAMKKIIGEAEKNYPSHLEKPYPSKKSETFMSDVVCFNAAKTAHELGATAIIGMTVSGYTGFKISSYRTKSEIFIFSSEPSIEGALNLVWGVSCFNYRKFSSTDQTIEDVIEILKEKGRIKVGDKIVFVGSMPLQKRLRTNMMKVAIVD